MNMLEGMAFFFDLTVPAALAVAVLLIVMALWSPLLSGAERNTSDQQPNIGNDRIPAVLAQPQRTARRQFSHPRALRYWNTRLDIDPGAPQTDLRGGGQVVTFRRTNLE